MQNIGIKNLEERNHTDTGCRLKDNIRMKLKEMGECM
jgi:hypothetical protein